MFSSRSEATRDAFSDVLQSTTESIYIISPLVALQYGSMRMPLIFPLHQLRDDRLRTAALYVLLFSRGNTTLFPAVGPVTLPALRNTSHLVALSETLMGER